MQVMEIRAVARRIVRFSHDHKTRLYYAACVVLLVVAAGLRFHDLPEKSLRTDEAVTANISRGALSEVIPGTRYRNSSPILYPLALYAVQKVDVSAFSARVLPALASVLTVAVLLFLLPRAGVSRWAAFLAALLATLSVEAIRHAQDVREYSIDALLAVLMIAGLLWYLRDGKKTLLCVSLFLAPLVQYGLVLFGVAVMGAAMILPPPATLAVSEWNSSLSRIRHWLTPRIALVWPAGCFLVGCAISYAVTVRYQWQLEGGYGYDDYYNQGAFDAADLLGFTASRTWDLLNYHLPQAVAVLAVGVLALMLTASLKRRRLDALVTLALLAVGIAIFAALLTLYPLGGIRQNLYLGPIVFLAVGVAFHWTAGCLASLTRRGWLAPALAVAVAGAIALAGVSAMRQDSPYQTPENIKSVLAVLQERVREEDMVYAGWGAVPAMQFYQGKEGRPANYHYGTSGWCTNSVESCLREMANLAYGRGTVNGRIWFVTYAHSTEFVEEAEIAGPDAGAEWVGDTITAYLVNDRFHRADDTPVNPWRWQRADPAPGAGNAPDDATWTNIEGARSFNYTPASEDEGKFLRAWMSYEKNGMTYRVQTEAIGPIIEGVALRTLLGEQVLVERIFTDVPGLSFEQVVSGGSLNLLPYLYLIEDREPLIDRYATLTRKPSIRSTFAVHLSEDMLIYVKEPCGAGDVEATFFLHVDPADASDLPTHHQRHGFDNLDFRFNDFGFRSAERCVAQHALPDYAITSIRTGQYTDEGRVWEGEVRFDE